MTETNMGRNIENMRIPDDDVPGWIETLRKGDFSDDEIDWMISHLNKTYAEKSGVIDKQLEKVKNDFLKKFGRTWSKEEENYYREGIRQRFGIENKENTKN